MRYALRALCVAAPLLGAAPAAQAQKVEFLYTKAALEQALDFKSKLTVKAAATNALSLFNISAERATAYLGTTAGNTAAVVFGDAAVKAVGAIEYTIPVIVVGATGKLAAKGPVIFVSSTEGTPVTAASAALPTGALAAGKVTSLKCSDADMLAVVGKLIADIAGAR